VADVYRLRVVDDELDELMSGVAAIALEGAKGVGKTATASRRATTGYRLNDPAQRAVAVADPSRLADGPPSVLIDEWQHVPESWDVVRRAVDDGAPPLGQFPFGLNEAVDVFTRNTLFDEKIGGTVHLALGTAYPECGGTNRSALHWDLICDLRSGSEVFADGELIYKDGRFLNGT